MQSSPEINDNAEITGKLIVGVGLPGSGKSSIFKAITEIVTARAFLEPEEDLWDRAVMKRDKYGNIGALHWFRSQRVPNLIDARNLADNGEIIFLDTFYDKICSRYLGKSGMEWLLDPKDPYFNNFLETANLDFDHLPDADVVILLRVTRTDWIKMLQCRGRELDKLLDSQDSHGTEDLFVNAAREYCERKGVKLVEFNNHFSTVEGSALLLHQSLVEQGVFL